MTVINFELKAEVRYEQGKGASRRLRRLNNRVPAIVYGGNEAPLMISLEHRDILKSIENEAFFSHILSLNIADTSHQVVLKDIQRHFYKKSIMHMDFQRVKPTDVISMQVPLHFLNEENCLAVKNSANILTHHTLSVDIRCMAKDLPEYIEVDTSNLDAEQALHLSDIVLPAGVELTSLLQGNQKEHDLPIISAHKARIAKEPETTTAAATPTTESTSAEKKKSTDKK